MDEWTKDEQQMIDLLTGLFRAVAPAWRVDVRRDDLYGGMIVSVQTGVQDVPYTYELNMGRIKDEPEYMVQHAFNNIMLNFSKAYIRVHKIAD